MGKKPSSLPKHSFSFDAFKQKWKSADSQVRMNMLRFAGELDVEDGLEPVMLGMKEYARPIRKEANNALEKLLHKATQAEGDDEASFKGKVKKTGRFTAFVYRELKLTKDLKLTELLFSTLLKIGGRGPALAWYFFSRGFVAENIMMEMIKRLPVSLQLILIHQYTLDRVWARKQYAGFVLALIEEISDQDAVVNFFADLFDHDSPPDPLFATYFTRADIHAVIRDSRLKSKKLQDRINGIKAASILGYPGYREAITGLLESRKSPEARIEILKLLTKPNAPNHSEAVEKVRSIVEAGEIEDVKHALSALISMRAAGLGKTLSERYLDDTSVREYIHGLLDTLEWKELNIFLNALSSELAGAARSSVGQMILEKNPDRMVPFLASFAKGDNPFKADAEKLLKEADPVRNTEIDNICKQEASTFSAPLKPKKKFFEKIGQKKRKKDLEERINRKFIKAETFRDEVISGIDLADRQLINVDFSGAILSDVNFSSARLDSVSFKDAYFENVTFDKAVLNAVSFENTALNKISAQEASLDGCSFIDSRIFGARFDLSSLQDTLFVNARITDTRFSFADLTASSFLNADVSVVSFRFALLDLADFSLAKATFCDFEGIDIYALTTLHAELNIRSRRFFDMVESSFPLAKALSQPGGFNTLMIANETRKTREAFLAYNLRRTDLAIDTFSPEQGELFELIPLLVHTDLELLPEDNPVRNAPAGIHGYHPSQRALHLLQKYFNVGGSAALHEITYDLQGVYTIGSIGTIAQSADSDIDYWICVDESKIEPGKLVQLKAKLAAIEQWALKIFETELHFFVVPFSEVREDRFGGSDQESSGSAQGKILKEEFYRTMILVAGRIPLWCAVPTWATEKYYGHFITVSSVFHKDLIDLGNVSAIPKGEYFGASIWQLLKSLKSPYKSVIKMALLEKYLLTDESDDLLCNQLKAEWTSGTHDMRLMDPYLVLFEEVFTYYQKTGQKQAVALLQLCFFLKLGIRWIQDLDDSVISTRKEVVKDYLHRWRWDPVKVQSLGSYRDWPFEKIFLLSNRINQFMVGTYEKLSQPMRTAKDSKIAITPEDLTILGRKMFAQFSKKASKVEKLPLMSHGKRLFDQLNLQYVENGNGSPHWQLVHQKKDKKKTEASSELLKEMGRIEELIVWLVRNDLVESTASLQLMPNPTPISIQDLTDFVTAINAFFCTKEIDNLPETGLLHKAHVFKLFLVVNFVLNRRLNRIHEYATVYVTTWGEFFCQVFTDKNGLIFVEDAVKKVKTQLGHPFAGDSIGYFIPRSSRKRIKANA